MPFSYILGEYVSFNLKPIILSVKNYKIDGKYGPFITTKVYI